MSDAELAKDILDTAWEFARLVLMIAGVSLFWMFRVVRGEPWTRKILYALTITGIFFLFASFMFLNAEGHQIHIFAVSHRQWAIYNVALLTASIGLVVYLMSKHLRSSKTVISIMNAPGTQRDEEPFLDLLLTTFPSALLAALWTWSFMYVSQVSKS